MLTKNDLQALQQIVKTTVKKEVSDEIKPIHRELKKIRKDLNADISTFDSDITDTKKRVDRIEDHLHLPPLQSN